MARDRNLTEQGIPQLAKPPADLNAPRATAVNVAGNIAMAALGALAGLLSARLLGPQGRGHLAAIQLLPALLANLVVLGFSEALVFFSAKDRHNAGRYTASIMVLIAPVVILLMLSGYFLLPIILGTPNKSLTLDARLYLLIIPVSVLVTIPYQALRGIGRFATWNVLRLGPTFIWLAVVVIFASSHTVEPGALTLAYVAGLALLLLPEVVALRRTLPLPFRAEKSTYGPLLRFGLPTMLALLPQTLNFRLDQVIMIGFVTPRQLGLYVVAVTWSAVLVPVVTGIGIAVTPRIASLDETSEKARVVSMSSRMGLLVGGLLAVLLECLTPLSLRLLFGPSFAGATVPALILIPAAVMLSWSYVVGEGVRGFGYPRVGLYAELVAVVVTGAGLAVLLPLLGIVGAAVTSLASYATAGLFQAQRLHRIAGCSFLELVRPRRDDARVIAAGFKSLRPGSTFGRG